MSKPLPIPLSSIRSSRVRGDIDGLIARKREIESKITDEEHEELERIKSDLITVFLKNNLERVKLPDGTPITRTTKTTKYVSPELLLEHKVSMATIMACTIEKKSNPYIVVGKPSKENGKQEDIKS